MFVVLLLCIVFIFVQPDFNEEELKFNLIYVDVKGIGN